MTESLRLSPAYTTLPILEAQDFSVDGGFTRAVEMCNGNGACRKLETGTMCPSFMVTREEEHSTRGRANALRMAISGALPAGAMSKFDIEAPEPPPVEVAAAPSQPLQPEDEACQGQLGELLGAQVILFETSKWDISDKGKALLDRVVGIVATCPEAHLTIVGRADPRGAAEDNQALSENRAEAVVAYLTEVGVSPSRLTPIGYGETFPLGTDEETLAKSRRIEFIVGRK